VRTPALLLALVIAASSCSTRKGPVASTAPAGGGLGSQVETFEHAWKRIGETYPYPDMKGLDWQGVHDELLPRARKARTRADLRPVLEDLLSRLGESHFVLLPAEAMEHAPLAAAATVAAVPAAGAPAAGSAKAPKAAAPAAGPGDLGLDVRPSGDDFLVTRVRPGGPAEAAGVKPGWLLASVNGHDLTGVLHALRASVKDGRAAALQGWIEAMGRLGGEEGSVARLGLVHGGGGSTTVEIVRSQPPGVATRLGNLPELHAQVEQRMLPGSIGYVRFNIFLIPVATPFSEAVRGFIDAGARGVVVDVRGNPGGIGAMVMGMAGHFIAEEGKVLGAMTTRQAELKFVATPRAPSQIFHGPLAVLVDETSMSTSEIFAAGLQENGRARVFGTRTAGMALPSVVEKLPNGDRMQFVFADLRGPSGKRIEGAGVEPDVVVAPDRAALLAGHDAVLDAAVGWIESQADMIPAPEVAP
jgi:carboxyl-terminal processing protease